MEIEKKQEIKKTSIKKINKKRTRQSDIHNFSENPPKKNKLT